MRQGSRRKQKEAEGRKQKEAEGSRRKQKEAEGRTEEGFIVTSLLHTRVVQEVA